jgi:spermidine synthase
MAIDGTLIGASRGWNFPVYSKQILIAHLPMLLDARIRSALQIGLGSASTLDALASHPTLDRIDCVEINPAVVRGSRLFEESRIFEDPRVRVIVDALLLLQRRPTTPWSPTASRTRKWNQLEAPAVSSTGSPSPG